MSIDLQDLFDQAGRHAPAPSLDGELIIRRGRLRRARRRVAVSTGIAAVTGLAVLGSVALADGLPGARPPARVGPAAAGSSPQVGIRTTHPTTPSGTPGTSKHGTPVGLAGVSLPDPAPGFPVRRAQDKVELTTLGHGRGTYKVATFLLAAVPETVESDAQGNESGTPNGPEVTVMVGKFPMPQREQDGEIDGHKVVTSPKVAGVTGYVTTHTEKGHPIRTLYFSNGDYTVMLSGIDGVTTAQLVDLGNALDGLQGTDSAPEE